MDTISELCNYDCATVIFDRLIPIELEMFRDNFEPSGLGAEIRSASRIRAMEMVAKNYWRNIWGEDDGLDEEGNWQDGSVMWQLEQVFDEEDGEWYQDLLEDETPADCSIWRRIEWMNAGEDLPSERPEIYYEIIFQREIKKGLFHLLNERSIRKVTAPHRQRVLEVARSEPRHRYPDFLPKRVFKSKTPHPNP